MLDALEWEYETVMPAPWATLYLITERQSSEARDDDPEVGSEIRRVGIYDLRNPGGDVIETSSNLSDLRDKQASYNILAVHG